MFHCTIEASEMITPTTLLLTLRKSSDEPVPFSYYPGQYAAISFRRGRRYSVARCFSLTSSPYDLERIQFSIRAKGRFTKRLASVPVGEQVGVRGPYGGFVVNRAAHHDLVLVAGGIGIAPFMSMLRTMRQAGDKMPVVLLYGVQTAEDIPFLDELHELNQAMPSLRIIYVMSKGAPSTLPHEEVRTGYVDEVLLSEVLGKHPVGKTVFVCGPPPMMNGVVSTVKKLGVSTHQVITEAFRQGAHRQTGKVVSWPRSMYAVGSLGVAIGTLTLLINDIVGRLPSVSLKKASEARAQLHSTTGSRESDIDTLVNSLPTETSSSKTVSPAVAKALAQTSSSESNTTSSSSTTSSTSTNSGTTPTSVPSTSTPAPTPAPAPAPKCTTSQSGVTTCA